MTTTLFLVRHGAHDWLGKALCGRMKGVHLNDEGRREAQALAARFRREGLDAIYTSPLERTRQTAEPIAAATGATVVPDDDLLEIDFGDWTGKTFDQLHSDPTWTQWNRARVLVRPPGGESMPEVQARLWRWLERTCARHSDGRVAGVAHGDVIKTLIAHVLGFSMDQHHRLEIGTASVTTLVAGDWGMRVIGVNETVR